VFAQNCYKASGFSVMGNFERLYHTGIYVIILSLPQ